MTTSVGRIRSDVVPGSALGALPVGGVGVWHEKLGARSSACRMTAGWLRTGLPIGYQRAACTSNWATAGQLCVLSCSGCSGKAAMRIDIVVLPTRSVWSVPVPYGTAA
jgi:hypothetical protein